MNLQAPLQECNTTLGNGEQEREFLNSPQEAFKNCMSIAVVNATGKKCHLLLHFGFIILHECLQSNSKAFVQNVSSYASNIDAVVLSRFYQRFLGFLCYYTELFHTEPFQQDFNKG